MHTLNYQFLGVLDYWIKYCCTFSIVLPELVIMNSHQRITRIPGGNLFCTGIVLSGDWNVKLYTVYLTSLPLFIFWSHHLMDHKLIPMCRRPPNCQTMVRDDVVDICQTKRICWEFFSIPLTNKDWGRVSLILPCQNKLWFKKNLFTFWDL